jgi:phospholipase/carboxylesterase
MHQKNIVTAGRDVSNAKKVLIMLHGRGADADDILSVAPYLNTDEYALLAPQATGNSWYPYSFLMPIEQNEPWLTSALEILQSVVDELEEKGFRKEHIYFAGFSQGACLSLEFLARNAQKYGGLVAFSGGLIGSELNQSNYKGDFDETPVFIGSSDPDPHIPVKRVNETAEIYKKMNANVKKIIYPGMGHTIQQAEIEEANKLVFT